MHKDTKGEVLTPSAEVRTAVGYIAGRRAKVIELYDNGTVGIEGLEKGDIATIQSPHRVLTIVETKVPG